MKAETVMYQCPHCGQQFEGSSEYAGVECDCKACGRRFCLEAVSEPPVARPNAFACYLGMFRRYVGFRGRTPRREFWWAFFINLIVSGVFVVIQGLLFPCGEDDVAWVVVAYSLAVFLPMLALQVRRLHDTNKSGWWVLLVPIPCLNIAYAVWLATDGDRGHNRFGNDPKGRS